MTVSSFVFTSLVRIGEAAPEETAIFIGSLSTTEGINVLPDKESSAMFTRILLSLDSFAIF